MKPFTSINYIDCFDGPPPQRVRAAELPHDVFGSIEDINNYLLHHKDVIDHVERRGGGRAVFLMFDEKTEELAASGPRDMLPSAKLRTGSTTRS